MSQDAKMPDVPGFRIAWETDRTAKVFCERRGFVGYVQANNYLSPETANWTAHSTKQRRCRVFSDGDFGLACEWLRLRHGQEATSP